MVWFDVSNVQLGSMPRPSEAVGSMVTRGPGLGPRVQLEAQGEPVYTAPKRPILSRWPTHPVAQAAYMAYTDHLPLALRPDDLWLCVAQGVADCVNADPETFHDMLLQQGHGTAVTVEIAPFTGPEDPSIPWADCLRDFESQLRAKMAPRAAEALSASFSTTSELDSLACSVVLMASLKAYVSYAIEGKCGIPKVALRGLPEDWALLHERVEALYEAFEPLRWWTESLLEVTLECARAAKGNPDAKFWTAMCQTWEYWGNDYDSFDEFRLGGWLNVFFPVLADGRRNRSLFWRTNAKGSGKDSGSYTDLLNLPKGLSTAPFQLVTVDGRSFQMDVLGGFVGVTVEEVDGVPALAPVTGVVVEQAERAPSSGSAVRRSQRLRRLGLVWHPQPCRRLAQGFCGYGADCWFEH